MAAARNNQIDRSNRPQMTAGERERLNAKKRKRRKRRRIFIICLLTVLLTAVLAGLTYGFITVFKVTAYRVDGTARYTPEQVFEASGLELGKNLFFSSIGEAEEQLEVMLPYIGSAEIKRKMPGTFLCAITETQAAVYTPDGEGFMLIDKNGKILEKAAAAAQDGIPLLSCPEPVKKDAGRIVEFQTPQDAIENPLDTYKKLLAAIESSSMADITHIDMANPLDVWLVYQDRIKMHLGTPAQLESRLRFAVTVIERENVISPDQRGEIDLTILKTAYFRPETEGTTINPPNFEN